MVADFGITLVQLARKCCCKSVTALKCWHCTGSNSVAPNQSIPIEPKTRPSSDVGTDDMHLSLMDLPPGPSGYHVNPMIQQAKPKSEVGTDVMHLPFMDLPPGPSRAPVNPMYPQTKPNTDAVVYILQPPLLDPPPAPWSAPIHPVFNSLPKKIQKLRPIPTPIVTHVLPPLDFKSNNM